MPNGIDSLAVLVHVYRRRFRGIDIGAAPIPLAVVFGWQLRESTAISGFKGKSLGSSYFSRHFSFGHTHQPVEEAIESICARLTPAHRLRILFLDVPSSFKDECASAETENADCYTAQGENEAANNNTGNATVTKTGMWRLRVACQRGVFQSRDVDQLQRAYRILVKDRLVDGEVSALIVYHKIDFLEKCSSQCVLRIIDGSAKGKIIFGLRSLIALQPGVRIGEVQIEGIKGQIQLNGI